MRFAKVVAGAFFYINKYKRVLVKALALPFVVYMVVDAAVLFDLHPAAHWFLAVLGFGAHTIFAITTHRIVLLGPNSVPTWGITSWSKRETFFVLHLIGLALLLLLLGSLGFIPIVRAVIVVVFVCWVIGRLFLVFPGIAVDKGVSFKLSWEMTRNYKMLMFLVAVMFPLLMAIPTMLLEYVPYTFLLSSFISTFVTVFEVAALSMAYQLITGDIYGKG